MTHLTYITQHLLPSWVRQWSCNFKIWSDLMTGNYEYYAVLEEDDPYQECYDWFWASINLDDILPKEFLESLYQMMDDIDTGVVKTYPAKDILRKLKEAADNAED